MQFKHPELLWGLLLLLIPIIIHLFRLRRFKKTPFTNVAMLQKAISESRKSSTLKKWLLLLTRLLLLGCIVLAFAQPYSANDSAIKPEETVVYVDNSFSMQGQQEGQPLLEKAVQGIVQHIGDRQNITLFTNDRTFKKVNSGSIKNELLSLGYSHQQLNLEQVLLKANTLFGNTDGTENHVIVISDFQQRFTNGHIPDSSDTQVHLVQLAHEESPNASIDSVYLDGGLNDQMTLKVVVKGLQPEQNIPISLLNGDRLIAKSAVEGSTSSKSELEFSIPSKEAIRGKLVLQDNALSYDNSFYFNIDLQEKINVMAIGDGDADFLRKIYSQGSFAFTNYSLQELNYSTIENQNLIVLNELNELPKSLQAVLKDFSDNGGHLLLIPSKEGNPNTYNSLLRSLGNIRYKEQRDATQKISAINFEHPVFINVFEKEITNFEYPEVKSYYTLNTQGSAVIRYTNGAPFLTNERNYYLFTAPLNSINSNFKNAPLIVPTLYNIGTLSLKLPELYQTIGKKISVDIPTRLEKDNILTLTGKASEFIPLQTSFSNRSRLTFEDLPQADGIYAVRNDLDTLQHLSFNFPRAESVLNYSNPENLSQSKVYTTIPTLFKDLEDSNAIADYWKWFVIFAIIFALLELLIQKILA